MSALGSAAALSGTRVAHRPSARPQRTQCGRVIQALASTGAQSQKAGLGVMATKAGMTTVFTPEGLALPCTVVALEEGNQVTQIKTKEKDGISSVQIGYQPLKDKNVKKPMRGHYAKSGVKPMRHAVEFRLAADVEDIELGQQLDACSLFPEGTLVDVRGKTVGKGFAGSIKRWGMARGLMSHGSKSHRQHGSIGGGHAGEGGRVLPGLHMAGQMGNKNRTVKKVAVVRADAERGALVLKGSIPGKPGNVVTITPSKIVGVNC